MRVQAVHRERAYISISSDDTSNSDDSSSSDDSSMFSIDQHVNNDYDMPYPKRGSFTLRGLQSNDCSTSET